MKIKRYCMLAAMALTMVVGAQAAKWERKQAALMTTWGEQIDPEQVWQQYPRPQLVRSEWMNLNGVW